MMKKLLLFLFVGLLLLGGTSCSMLEQVETREYQMKWRIDLTDKNQNNPLDELSFVDFPGHYIGEYSNQLAEHLKAEGKEQVSVTLEITHSAFGDVSYGVREIAGLKQWLASYSYGGTSGSPERSPFD